MTTQSEMNIIPMYSNLSRAIEIAVIGNLSIDVRANLDLYPQAANDYKFIKEFYKPIFQNWRQNSDLIVELCPPVIENNKNGQTLDDKIAYINKVRLNPKPELHRSKACENLIQTATTRVGLGLKQLDTLNKIALTAAQLGGEEDTKIEHFAEAIQYSYSFDCCTSLEAYEFKEKIDLTKCTPSDQVRIILSIYGDTFTNAKNYEFFVAEFESKISLCSEGWGLLLSLFESKDISAL